MMKQAVKKLSLVLPGCLIAFVFIELVLQAAGAINLSFYNKIEEDWEYAPGVYRIVCIGDSWTYGVGADERASYPQQLETLLNSQGEKEFKVYNLGYPDLNAALAVEKLEKAINIRPHMVIAMIGRDGWDLAENDNIRDLAGRIKKAVFSLKTVKLVNIGLYNLNHREKEIAQPETRPEKSCIEKALPLIKQANAYRQEGDFIFAHRLYDQALGSAPGLTAGLIEKGRAYKLEKKYGQALAVFKRAVLSDPFDEQVIGEINDVFTRSKNKKGMADFYEQAYRQRPDNALLKEQLVRACIVLADHRFRSGKYRETIALYEKAAALDPANEKLYNSICYNQALLKLQEKGYKDAIPGSQSLHEKRLQKSLLRLADICKKNGIELILSGYPKEMFRVTEEFAGQRNVPLIDHRRSFQASPDKLFAKDGHCNNKGYRLIAENLLPEVRLIISRTGSGAR